MYSDKMIHGNKPNVVTRAMSRMAASQKLGTVKDASTYGVKMGVITTIT